MIKNKLRLHKRTSGYGPKYKITFGNRLLSTHKSSLVANRKYNKILSLKNKYLSILKIRKR